MVMSLCKAQTLAKLSSSALVESIRTLASFSLPAVELFAENDKKYKIPSPSVDLLSGILSPENAHKSSEIVKSENFSQDQLPERRVFNPQQAELNFLGALSKFLTNEYHEPVLRRNVVATNGASSSLLYLIERLFPKKCPVFVEELSYFQALESLRDKLRYPILGVPFDQDGINVGELERQLKATRSMIFQDTVEESHGFWAVLYLVPAFHNPTGSVMSIEKRRRIIELARKYRVLVICDDVYNLLYFKANQPPSRLFSHDHPGDSDYIGNVISNGSFSKFWSPGIKMGWMELPEWLKEFWDLNSERFHDVFVNAMACQSLVGPLRSGAVSNFVAGLRRGYIEKTAIVQWILECELPEGCSFKVPQGGSFFWIELPKFMSAAKVQQEAFSRYGIVFLNGQRCAANGSLNYQNCLRISISYNERRTLSRAVRELCAVIRDLHKMEQLSMSFWCPGHA